MSVEDAGGVSDDTYICPNGHDFPVAVGVMCVECFAQVICVPLSRLIRQDEAPRRDRERVELEHPNGASVTLYLPAPVGHVGDVLFALGALGYVERAMIVRREAS